VRPQGGATTGACEYQQQEGYHIDCSLRLGKITGVLPSDGVLDRLHHCHHLTLESAYEESTEGITPQDPSRTWKHSITVSI
jgi:hypothetical protein